MNKNIGFILGIFVIAGGGYFFFSRGETDKKDMAQNDTINEQVMNTENEGVLAEKEETTTEKKDGALMEKKETMVKAGSYQEYSGDKIALAATGDVVLFFHASWCPSCRVLNGDIEKNVSAIPAGVTILKTDYDKETELKKKYGATTQHTLVQVDKDGNLIKKWSGGSKLTNLLSQIQ